jgi:hypothetical protein
MLRIGLIIFGYFPILPSAGFDSISLIVAMTGPLSEHGRAIVDGLNLVIRDGGYRDGVRHAKDFAGVVGPTTFKNEAGDQYLFHEFVEWEVAKDGFRQMP